MARNLTFENSTPDSSDWQALALRCDADRAIFDNVRFLGYQDTLFVWSSSRQYFRQSFISGDVDFIFGNATAVFDRCKIESTDRGYITAADTMRTTANGLIFLDCELVKGSRRRRTTAANNSVFLGRPWLHIPRCKCRASFSFARGWGRICAGRLGSVGFHLASSINRDPYTRVSEWGSMNLAGPAARGLQSGRHPDGRVGVGRCDDRGAGGQLHPPEYFWPSGVLERNHAARNIEHSVHEPGRAVESRYAVIRAAGETRRASATPQHLDSSPRGRRARRWA